MRKYLVGCGVLACAIAVLAWNSYDWTTGTAFTATGVGAADSTYITLPFNMGEVSHVDMSVTYDSISGEDTTTATAYLQTTVDGTNYTNLITFTGKTAAATERKAVERSSSNLFGGRARIKVDVTNSSSVASTWTGAYSILVSE